MSDEPIGMAHRILAEPESDLIKGIDTKRAKILSKAVIEQADAITDLQEQLDEQADDIKKLQEAVREAAQILDSYSHSEDRYGCGDWLQKYGSEKEG